MKHCPKRSATAAGPTNRAWCGRRIRRYGWDEAICAQKDWEQRILDRRLTIDHCRNCERSLVLCLRVAGRLP